MILFVVVFLSILCVVGVAHWYLWRRLVRDTSAPGSRWRRTGTVLIFLMPALLVAAQVTSRTGAPFGLQRVVAWPGLMWFAVLIYLLLTLVALEAVRPLVLRWLRRRDVQRAEQSGTPDTAAPDTDDATPGTDGSAAPLPADGETGGGRATAVAAKPASGDATAADTATHTATHTGSHRQDGPARRPSGENDGDGPRDASRRMFIARTAAVTAGTVAAVTVGAGTYSVLASGPKVKHVDVTLAKLPPSADGYRITLISDIHMSPVIGRSVTQRIVDRANATKPDLIAIAGDLVDGSVKDLRGAAQPLGRLTAREGVFFATGNHEYYSGYQEWNAHLAGPLGIRVLRNERAELRYFDIVGVNDLAGEEYDDAPDLPKALAGRDTDRPAVLIAHQPAMIDEARKHGVDLQLSGHTHGGQMWPGDILAALANPTLFGLERYGDSQLYVTRGAGAWGPPVRVGAEPDITVLTLRAERS